MEYESQRLKRIEENKRKMKELGIKPHAYEAICSMDQKARKINKMKPTKVLERDDDYILDEGCEVHLSSEEDDIEITQNTRSLRSQSKKVISSKGQNFAKNCKSKYSTMSMSSMVHMQPQARKDQEQQRKGKDLQKKVLTPAYQQQNSKQSGRLPSQGKTPQSISMPASHQEKDAHKNTLTNKGKGKMVAPGSLNAYILMKQRSRERQSNQICAFPDDSINLRTDLSSELEFSDDHSGDIHGLVEEDDNLERSDDDIFEKEKAADAEQPSETPINATSKSAEAALRNGLISPEGHQTDKLVLQKQKRKRGPTMCNDVHERSIDERKPIILNELGQPIGPSKSTLDEFSRFLGSVARNSYLAPLNKVDWHKVPYKDQIWEYVKTKYMIAEEGKSYVLHSVGALWRNYKCRIKKKHYKAYDNMKDRWNNRPKEVHVPHFKELIKFWSLENIQEISEKNTMISKCQMDRHTAGPISFARKRYELEKVANVPPSKAALYRETRKRKPERTYKTIERNIMEEEQAQEHHTLLGRCTKRVKGPATSGMLIPDEFLQPYKTNIVKETVNEMMKILQQALPSEMFARIAPSSTNPSSNLVNGIVNGLSSRGINDIDQCQNDGDRDAEVNDHDDLEGDEKEMQDED